jgi:hypothetical protein
MVESGLDDASTRGDEHADAASPDEHADAASPDAPLPADAASADAPTADVRADAASPDAPTPADARADALPGVDVSDAAVSEDGGPPLPQEACTSVPSRVGSIGGVLPVQGIAVDGRYVYLADAQRGAILRMDLSGKVETLVISDLADGIVLVGSALYWRHLHGISTMPASGGTPTLLVDELFNGEGAFALDATYLYWVKQSAGTVSKIPRGGGARVQLAAGIDEPASIAVAASDAYVTSYGGSVLRIPLAGGLPISYGSGLMAPDAIVVHATGVYWGNLAGDTVMRMPLGGGTPETFDSGHNPKSLVFGGDALYWLSYSTSGFIRKVALDGSSRSDIATDIPLAWRIALSDKCVYWTDGNGVIMYVSR